MARQFKLYCGDISVIWLCERYKNKKKESSSSFIVIENPNWSSEILDKGASYTKQNIKIILKHPILRKLHCCLIL